MFPNPHCHALMSTFQPESEEIIQADSKSVASALIKSFYILRLLLLLVNPRA